MSSNPHFVMRAPFFQEPWAHRAPLLKFWMHHCYSMGSFTPSVYVCFKASSIASYKTQTVGVNGPNVNELLPHGTDQFFFHRQKVYSRNWQVSRHISVFYERLEDPDPRRDRDISHSNKTDSRQGLKNKIKLKLLSSSYCTCHTISIQMWTVRRTIIK